MTLTRHNPADLHDPTPYGYAHTVAVPAGAGLVLVAGQYASGPDGAVVAADFATQVEQSFANLATALAGHGLGLADVASLRTYVVGLGYDELGAVAAVVGRLWAGAPPVQTVLGVAALATPDLRFEVEAVAALR